MSANIYCRSSRLTSLCMRYLIERYMVGDTAIQAQRYVTGDGDQPGLHEPDLREAARFVDRFLAIYPSSFGQVRRFAEHCREQRPQNWRPIAISRQAVNTVFLKLGWVCWERVAEPHLRAQAQRSVRVFDELNRELGLIDADIAALLVKRMAERYVKIANGSLPVEPDVTLRYGRTIDYLRERAVAQNGLNLARSREHMGWAFVLNSVERHRGIEDRCYGARVLTGLLMRSTM